MAQRNLDELKRRIRGETAPKAQKSKAELREEIGGRSSVTNLIERLSESKKAELGTIVKKEERLVIQSDVSDLGSEQGAFIGVLSGFYKRVAILDKLTNIIVSSNFGKQLGRNLTAAGITYSSKQYVGLILTYAFLALFILIPYLFLICTLLNFPIIIAFLGGIVASVLAVGMGMVYPGIKATNRAKTVERELAFGLRHLSTQVKAGIGLNTAMESVAEGGYGLLSEEFRIALDDIGKGAATVDALTSMRLRNRSKGMRRALTQIIRALRTGGSLSDLLSMIANDVSYELRMRMKDFGERLNMVGVLFMFVCVVFPVMVSILISVYPLLGNVPPQMMLFVKGYFYLLAPVMSLFIVYLVRMLDPA